MAGNPAPASQAALEHLGIKQGAGCSPTHLPEPVGFECPLHLSVHPQLKGSVEPNLCSELLGKSLF